MLTRHARRVYAGSMPPRVTEQEILDFFNGTVLNALGHNASMYPGGVVKKVYQNVDKCYAFIEFPSVELTTACMQLDGIKFDHPTGPAVVRIRRPNDYKPELLPHSDAIVPELNLDGVAGVGGGGGGGSGGGPGKIFIGGLPYNLLDEQIMELLGAFGTIKQFHQVRDPGSVTSKGYAFCEYNDPVCAETAIQGLNGMKLGEKVLSVRVAIANATGGGSSAAPPPPPQANPLLAGLQLGGMAVSGGSFPMPPQFSNPYGAYGAPPPPPVNALASQQPTRVLKLSNMATDEELEDNVEYEDIIDDIRQECSDHGQVGRVMSPRVKDGFAPSKTGCHVYVQFNTPDMARAAAMALNGRKFAEKTVVVEYYDEMMFSKSMFQ
jgi:splicing factor U2AF subunit